MSEKKKSFEPSGHKMNNEQSLVGRLFDIGDDELPNYMGIIS